jgi:hypothetical protein
MLNVFPEMPNSETSRSIKFEAPETDEEKKDLIRRVIHHYIDEEGRYELRIYIKEQYGSLENQNYDQINIMILAALDAIDGVEEEEEDGEEVDGEEEERRKQELLKKLLTKRKRNNNRASIGRKKSTPPCNIIIDTTPLPSSSLEMTRAICDICSRLWWDNTGKLSQHILMLGMVYTNEQDKLLVAGNIPEMLVNGDSDAVRCEMLQQMGYSPRGLDNKHRTEETVNGWNPNLKASMCDSKSIITAFIQHGIKKGSMRQCHVDYAMMPKVNYCLSYFHLLLHN